MAAIVKMGKREGIRWIFLLKNIDAAVVAHNINGVACYVLHLDCSSCPEITICVKVNRSAKIHATTGCNKNILHPLTLAFIWWYLDFYSPDVVAQSTAWWEVKQTAALSVQHYYTIWQGSLRDSGKYFRQICFLPGLLGGIEACLLFTTEFHCR